MLEEIAKITEDTFAAAGVSINSELRIVYSEGIKEIGLEVLKKKLATSYGTGYLIDFKILHNKEEEKEFKDKHFPI